MFKTKTEPAIELLRSLQLKTADVYKQKPARLSQRPRPLLTTKATHCRRCASLELSQVLILQGTGILLAHRRAFEDVFTTLNSSHSASSSI
jgi:hypothetical protein